MVVGKQLALRGARYSEQISEQEITIYMIVYVPIRAYMQAIQQSARMDPSNQQN